MSSIYAALFALLSSLGMDPSAACAAADAPPTLCLPPAPPAPPPTGTPRTLTNDIYNGF